MRINFGLKTSENLEHEINNSISFCSKNISRLP